jgi:hypothetical protein
MDACRLWGGALLMAAHRVTVLARRCLLQPVPEILPQLSEDAPVLDSLGKPQDDVPRQYAVWNAGEIRLLSNGNYVEINVLHAACIVNQVNPNHMRLL